MVPSTHPCGCFVPHPLWRKNDVYMAKKISWKLDFYVDAKIIDQNSIRDQLLQLFCKEILIERLPYFETWCCSPFHDGKSLGGMCLDCKRLLYDTSICERNWSIWNQIQTKKRNRLSMK
jgi:hypothetical protein